ncbi:MAG TPA: VOC family protein [Solirubrobacteraceae bacterium]|nr:VOC family protein [Solirubrobacteraceae bacterium]
MTCDTRRYSSSLMPPDLPAAVPRRGLACLYHQEKLYRSMKAPMGSGYGHIAITSDNLDGTLARLAEQGIEPEKPPYSVREGGSRLCFVQDPDGYRIEILEMG